MKRGDFLSESILTPILLGFVVNVVLFFISHYVVKNKVKATHVTFFAALLVLIGSLVIGSWVGMGVGIISFGMFISTLLLYLFNFIPSKNVKKNMN